MVAKHLSIAELERELNARQKALETLASRHKSLASELQGLESEMASIRGTGSAGRTGGRPARKARRGRPPGRAAAASASRAGRVDGRARRSKNEMTLPDAIAAAMKVGAVVSPKQAAGLVKAAGYKTASKTFGIQVATTLAKDKRFKRMGRGQYKRVK